VAFLLAVYTLAETASAEERIRDFTSEVEVLADASLRVRETITVQVEQQEIRRGILRDFPTLYTDRLGRQIRVGFDVRGVVRDGQPEPYRLESLANGTRIRIGDPDLMLSRGPHRYVIDYATTRQIGFFPQFDELYWNVTGNGWTFPIDRATTRIRLPAGTPIVQAAYYTGPQGARLQNVRILEQRLGFIAFQTTRPLAREEGLTVAVAFPKGIVREPDRQQVLFRLISDNRAAVAATGGLAALLLYFTAAWLRVGRDPPRGTIIPLFKPPPAPVRPCRRYTHLPPWRNPERCHAGRRLQAPRRPSTRRAPHPARVGV
jgi:hypothetical protein